jgi:hypothetical protein
VLGQRIVDEFAQDSRVDTLGKWISHDLASKILKAKAAKGTEKQALEADCRDTILTLWKHRASYPSGQRPFESYEAAFRALESLDPLREKDRYFSYIVDGIKNAAEKKSKTEEWLDAASRIDRAARAIIRLCLANAIDNLPGDKSAWIEEATKVLDDEDLDVKIVIRFLSDTQQLISSETEKLQAAELERLKGFQESLNALTKAAAQFRAYLDESIKSLS